MKKFFASFLVLFSAITIFAQAPGSLGKNDPEAKKILDAVSSKFKTYKAVQASFSLKMENGAGKIS